MENLIYKFYAYFLWKYGAFFEQDEAAKAEKMKKVTEETIPKGLVSKMKIMKHIW